VAFNQRRATHRWLNKFDRKVYMYKHITKNISNFTTKHNMVCGKCICARCDTVVRKFYYIKEDLSRTYCALCTDCALELNPPKWKVIIATINTSIDNRIEPIGNYEMWDDTNKRKECTMTLTELVSCGWFIKKVEETNTLVPKRTIKKIDLEYHGKLMCLRFKDHYEKLGLEYMEKCKSPFCEFVYDNIRNNVGGDYHAGRKNCW